VWRRRWHIERIHGRVGTALALLRGFFPGLVVVTLSLGCEAVANCGDTYVIFEDNKPQRSSGPGLVAIDGGATLEFVGVGDSDGDEDGTRGCGVWREEETREG
jgi:hypothetical protein